MICPYEQYYSHQAGSGIGIVYKGLPHQRGHGIGSFLGGLFRTVLPFLKSGAKAVGKELLHGGVGVLSDVINSQPIQDSVNSRFKVASTNLKKKADDKVNSLMTGSGYKRKRLKRAALITPKTSKRKSSKRKRSNQSFKDIFSI